MTRLIRLAPCLMLALSGVAILAETAAYWGASAELLNRGLIVAVAIWLMFRSKGRPIDSGATRSAWIVGVALLATALAAMPLGWFLAVQVGPRPVLLWWLSAGWLSAASGVILIESSWRGLRILAFPLLFLMFVLPLPQRIEQPVQTLMQETTTSLSSSLLSLLGIAVEREGFVLQLPHGDLEVLEACSGIRSAMALTAIAALLAYWRAIGFIRGGIFVGLGLPVVIIANSLRVTAGGILQETVGINAVRGTPHELLGFVAFLLGLAALVSLSRLFHCSSPSIEPVFAQPARPQRSSRLVAGMLGLSLLACITAALFGRNSVERQQQTAPLEEISMSLGDWRGEEIPVPDEIRDMLTFDRASHRIYRDPIGQELHAWVIFWSGAGSVRGYHHPDVCWPNHGWTLFDKRVEEIDRGVPVSMRLFANGERRQMLCYWTQEGGRFWSDADEEAAQLEGTPGHRWIGERLLGGPVQRSGRLAVLIAADLWSPGGFAEKSLLDFCRRFAAELYRAMPWAAPQSVRQP